MPPIFPYCNIDWNNTEEIFILNKIFINLDYSQVEVALSLHSLQ